MSNGDESKDRGANVDNEELALNRRESKIVKAPTRTTSKKDINWKNAGLASPKAAARRMLIVALVLGFSALLIFIVYQYYRRKREKKDAEDLAAITAANLARQKTEVLSPNLAPKKKANLVGGVEDLSIDIGKQGEEKIDNSDDVPITNSNPVNGAVSQPQPPPFNKFGIPIPPDIVDPFATIDLSPSSEQTGIVGRRMTNPPTISPSIMMAGNNNNNHKFDSLSFNGSGAAAASNPLDIVIEPTDAVTINSNSENFTDMAGVVRSERNGKDDAGNAITIYNWPIGTEPFPQYDISWSLLNGKQSMVPHKVKPLNAGNNPNASMWLYSPAGDVVRWDESKKQYVYDTKSLRILPSNFKIGLGDWSKNNPYISPVPAGVASGDWSKQFPNTPFPPPMGIKLANKIKIDLAEDLGGGYLYWLDHSLPPGYSWFPNNRDSLWDAPTQGKVNEFLPQIPSGGKPAGDARSQMQILLSRYSTPAKNSQRPKPQYKMPPTSQNVLTEAQLEWNKIHCNKDDPEKWFYYASHGDMKIKIDTEEAGKEKPEGGATIPPPPPKSIGGGLCVRTCEKPNQTLRVWKTLKDAVFSYGCQSQCPEGTQDIQGVCRRRIENPEIFFSTKLSEVGSERTADEIEAFPIREDYRTIEAREYVFCPNTPATPNNRPRFWGGRCYKSGQLDYIDANSSYTNTPYDYGSPRAPDTDVINCPIHDMNMKLFTRPFKKTADGKRCYRCTRNDMLLLGNAVDGYVCADECPPGSNDYNTAYNQMCITNWERRSIGDGIVVAKRVESKNSDDADIAAALAAAKPGSLVEEIVK